MAKAKDSPGVGGYREGAGRKPPAGMKAARVVSVKLYEPEIEEMKEIAARLEISQSDVMRLGIAAARSKLKKKKRPA